MDSGTLLLGFVPVASAAIGAGATYLWQVLGNRRSDEAIRVQTNARLLELTSIVSNIYQVKWFPVALTPILQRLVTSLDDSQIALAFRNDPDVLWKLGQIRIHCEYITAQSADDMKKHNPDPSSLEKARDTLRWYAGNVLALTMTTFKDESMLKLALKVSSSFGFSEAEHQSMVLREQQQSSIGNTQGE